MKKSVHSLESVNELIAKKSIGYKFMREWFVPYHGFISWLRRYKNMTMGQAKISNLSQLVEEYEDHVLEYKHRPKFEELYDFPKSSFVGWLERNFDKKWADIKENPDHYIKLYGDFRNAK